MKWKLPPIIKIYEAIGAIADDRVQIDGNSAKVYSSSRNKYYEVSYSPEQNAIMANDNGSYWKGYLGYPAIAFLMEKEILEYDRRFEKLLVNIQWKDINQQYKNDFDKTLSHVLKSIKEENRVDLMDIVDKIYDQIKELNISLLGDRVEPPEGY